MADSGRALSQWEIDNLLNQIPDGAGGTALDQTGTPAASGHADRSLARVIKAYDFRRPDKFSKEQWQTLTTMHETFARVMGAQFSSRMRTLVTVRLSSIDQGLYEEWQLQIPAGAACYVLSMPPLNGSLVVEFSHDVALDVVERLLGGTAMLPTRDHEMTDIEVALLRSFARVLTISLSEMWTHVIRVEPEVQDLGFDASVIQVAGPNDVVVTAFFEVNLGNRLGAMSVCMPYTVLEQVTAKLSAQVWLAQGQHAGTDARAMRALLGTAPLDLSVELGATEVPARTIIDLREGDTLVLDARVDRPMPMMIGGARRFTVRPGMVGNRVGVRVADVLPPRTYPELDTVPSAAVPEPALLATAMALPAAVAVAETPAVSTYEEAGHAA